MLLDRVDHRVYDGALLAFRSDRADDPPVARFDPDAAAVRPPSETVFSAADPVEVLDLTLEKFSRDSIHCVISLLFLRDVLRALSPR